MNSLSKDDVQVIHTNLNDQSVEGIRHKKYPAFSIQYHPEAAPGPHDSQYVFQQFIDMMEAHKTKGAK
jgi:carbamoyl-phosphate synthase small subunit